MSRPKGVFCKATPIGGTHGYAVFVTSLGIEIRGYDGVRIANSAMTIGESEQFIALIQRGIEARREQIRRRQGKRKR